MYFNDNGNFVPSENFNLANFEAKYAREERDRDRLDAMRPITHVPGVRRQEIEAARAAKADASLRANCIPLLRSRNYN